MRQAEPDRIEFCLLSGERVDPFSISYPYGHEISFGHYLALTQQSLRTYWRNEGGTLRAQRKYGKSNPLPELVRVVGDNGEELCRWSVNDLLQSTSWG
jgi:hypothetical protein